MISRAVFWRSILRDRIFVLLVTLTLLTFIMALLQREPSIEIDAVPFQLAVLFFIVNVAFSFLTIRREPLLAYMFLTATILSNSTLFAFFRYLLSIQMG